MPVQLTTGASFNNQKATNLADGSSPTDAVTKQQLDAIARGLDWKNSAKAATTANLTLSAPQTVDGISLVAGDRVLVKDQTIASANGIYLVAAGAWTRATDFDDATEVTAAAVVPVEQGTVNGDKAFILTTDGAIVIGTTSLAFTPLGGGGISYTPADNTITISGSTIAVKVKASSGILVDGSGIYVDPTFSPNRLEADVPSGSATVDITHALGVQYLSDATVYDKTSGQMIECDKFATDGTHFRFVFAVAPTTAQYRYILGK